MSELDSFFQNLFPSDISRLKLNMTHLLAQDKEQFLAKVLETSTSCDKEQMTKTELINQAMDAGADVNKAISYLSNPGLEFFNQYKELLLNHPTNPISPTKFLRLVLETALNENIEDFIETSLLELSVCKGADLNEKINHHFYDTFLDIFFATGRFELIDKALKPDMQINTLTWLIAAYNYPGIEFMVEAIKRFPNGLSIEESYKVNKGAGPQAMRHVKNIIDTYNLAQDFLNGDSLSEAELSLLDKTRDTLPLEIYRNTEIQNKYGFTALQLALLGKKCSIALEMIENDFSLTEKNKKGISAIEILFTIIEHTKSICTKEQVVEFHKLILNKLDNFDIILNENEESVLNILIDELHYENEILVKTNDPLFTFYKKDSNLFQLLDSPNITHIAISDEYNCWSPDTWSWSRLTVKEHPNVKFYLVNLDMIEKGGDKFIKQFDGWINPEAPEDFPKHLKEFTISDWKPYIPTTATFLKVSEKTFEFNIPFLGISTGAEIFALYHNGSLSQTKKYQYEPLNINYLQGTLPHFMAMTKEQQKSALKNCELPEIKFESFIQFAYAAKLGNGIQLGAISEDGVAMSYAHENGIRYATQFQPEHFYVGIDDQINHQKSWLDNFIHLANLHHDYRLGKGEHPEIIFQYIKERLDQCSIKPTCLINDHNIFNNATIELDFFLDKQNNNNLADIIL